MYHTCAIFFSGSVDYSDINTPPCPRGERGLIDGFLGCGQRSLPQGRLPDAGTRPSAQLSRWLINERNGIKPEGGLGMALRPPFWPWLGGHG